MQASGRDDPSGLGITDTLKNRCKSVPEQRMHMATVTEAAADVDANVRTPGVEVR